jgi:hypothetical protein
MTEFYMSLFLSKKNYENCVNGYYKSPNASIEEYSHMSVLVAIFSENKEMKIFEN